MSSNEIETNDMNGPRLAEQRPSPSTCSQQGNIGHHANPVISKRRKWTSEENKIVMECYLLSEPKIRGYRKPMLSLWLQKDIFWASRLQNQIKELRKDLSQLEASKDKDINNFRHWERLERKYSIRVKILNVYIEELKHRITAFAAKVRRYQERVDSY